MRTLLQGGQIVTGTGVFRADVLLEGEKILAVGLGLDACDAQITDVSGKLLLPGLIDAHTHFDLDVCNTTTADDFASGSRAALRGGTTTVIDFACPNRGESLQHGLELWHSKAQGKSVCDYGFHMTIDDWSDSIEAELPEMIRQGITSFKMYMTYPAMMLQDRDLFCALKALHKLGCIAGIHCENSGLIDAKIAEEKAAGHFGPDAHPRSRPDIAEAEAVGRLLHLAQAAGTPVVIVHLSSAAGLREVEAARRRGQTVYVETCPQYLAMDDSLYSLPDFQGARYVCAPPLRKPDDIKRLWTGLAHNEIQTVSTDHCSFTLAQKAAGRTDFTAIPGGMPGVETRGLIIYTLGVAQGRITLPQMVRLLAENPAKLYGLFPRKGILAPGSDADLVILDPAKSQIITAADSLSACGYAPMEGFQTACTIHSVYLRGKLAVKGGILQDGIHGQYLSRGLSALS